MVKSVSECVAIRFHRVYDISCMTNVNFDKGRNSFSSLPVTAF